MVAMNIVDWASQSRNLDVIGSAGQGITTSHTQRSRSGILCGENIDAILTSGKVCCGIGRAEGRIEGAEVGTDTSTDATTHEPSLGAVVSGVGGGRNKVVETTLNVNIVLDVRVGVSRID
jgi:hypothetical protein